ncbi:MAG TPA: hypothetical protein VNZ59_03455, partial [Burkholderiales bacterium]|nr:hypothetical protein [Burkholderiales bacterium]
MDVRKILLAAAALLLIHGCGSVPRHAAVPAELTAKAEIPGMPGVRFVAGGDMTEFRTIALDGLRRELEYRAQHALTGPLPPSVFLAISGGGGDATRV